MMLSPTALTVAVPVLLRKHPAWIVRAPLPWVITLLTGTVACGASAVIVATPSPVSKPWPLVIMKQSSVMSEAEVSSAVMSAFTR